MNKIRKGDHVVVLTGRDKGKQGVVSARKDDSHLLIDGINMVKKHVKPNPMKNQPGGIVDRDMPIHVSNVMLLCKSCGKPTRVGFKIMDDGRKVRFAKRSGDLIDG